MNEQKLIDHLYRRIEGYFGDESEDSLTLSADQIAHEMSIPASQRWGFDIAYKRFVEFVEDAYD